MMDGIHMTMVYRGLRGGRRARAWRGVAWRRGVAWCGVVWHGGATLFPYLHASGVV